MEQLIVYSSPFPKKRIGRNNDGGYVIALLPETYDLFISGGISNDISFENHLLELYPELTCYAFDGTVSQLPSNSNSSRLHFIKKNLGNTNNEHLTDLNETMEPCNTIFMKIDIEGHEFRLMPTIIQRNAMHKIKQLVIEIHSPADIQLFPDYFKGLGDVKNEHMFALFTELNKTHTLVHFHANNGCNLQNIDGIALPHVFELTYIRNDFITEKIKNRETLPTSLDIKNALSKPDYELKGFPYSTSW